MNYTLVAGKFYSKKVQKLVKKNFLLLEKIIDTQKIMTVGPFEQKLRTHKVHPIPHQLLHRVTPYHPA